jgi:hypothetical protein
MAYRTYPKEDILDSNTYRQEIRDLMTNAGLTKEQFATVVIKDVKKPASKLGSQINDDGTGILYKQQYEYYKKTLMEYAKNK